MLMKYYKINFSNKGDKRRISTLIKNAYVVFNNKTLNIAFFAFWNK